MACREGASRVVGGAVAIAALALASCGETSRESGAAHGAAGSGGASDSCDGRPFYLDADGDGYGVPHTPQPSDGDVCMRSANLPDAYSHNDDDCDDSDPARFVAYYPDDDGDGVGRLDPELQICGDDEQPNGYAPAGETGDCDDDDPGIYPGQLDVGGDGIDHDCDGQDDPSCYGSSLSEHVPDTVPTRADCPERPDLYVLSHYECDVTRACTLPTYVLVANAGGASFEGPLSVRVFEIAREEWGGGRLEYEPLRVDLDISLGPGERTYSVLVGYLNQGGGAWKFQLELDLGDFVDCDPSNDTTEPFFSTHVDCF